MKENRSNEFVEVFAYSVTYDVQDEHLETSIAGYGIRELGEELDPIDARISITFGPAKRCEVPIGDLSRCSNGYSTTSSARNKIEGGTVRPSFLAVLAFTAISNFTGT